jgi:hypothetical protein
MADNVTPMPSLDDVKSILAPDASDDPVVGLTQEEADVAAKILPRLTAKVAQEARVREAKRMDAALAEFKVLCDAKIKETIEQIQKDSKPLAPDEVEKMLSKEYATVTFTVETSRGTRNREFILGELPARTELRFADILRKKLLPYVKELTGEQFRGLDNANRIQRFIEVVPEGLELAAELAAICLNPRKEFDDINQDWVLDNLSSYRITNVLIGQFTVNRIRDFFSGAYLGMRP